MATSQAAFKVEQAIGHDGSATTQQDVSNPALDRSKFADPSGEKMKALLWLGKNHVEIRKLHGIFISAQMHMMASVIILDINTSPRHTLTQA